MAFSIDQFRNTLDVYGGPARNNLFMVTLTDNGNGFGTQDFDNRDLQFFCKTVTMPGVTLNVFDYRPNTIDMPQSMPFAMHYQSLECSFIVDDQHNVMRYFHNWMRRVMNFRPVGAPGADSFSNNQLSYEIGYKRDYAQTMTITKFSRNASTVSSVARNGTAFQYDSKYECKLFDVYPVHVSGTNLSWADNDSYTELPVAFSYSSFEMSSFDTPGVVDTSSIGGSN
jgi:hypothetical protein